MHIKVQPDAVEKLTRMGDVTLFEPAGDNPPAEIRDHHLSNCVAHVQTPKGAKPVLKTMVTTACEKNCFYCPFRAGRGQTHRATFKPDELATTFDAMQRAKVVDGLFLSSGIIKGGVTAQDKIIDTVEIIRKKHQYQGYVHLKIMPGAERDQIHRAMQLADRVSINLEGPTPERLERLAPKKDFGAELVQMLQWAGELKKQTPGKLASLVTQFVVGAVGDTDLELLSLSEKLYRQVGLARAYYSVFHPIEHTPFENLDAESPKRGHRLYQSSFLLRDYGWDVEELPFVDAGNLRRDVDPKRAWADLHLQHAPIDVMKADRAQLLRIPGIGPRSADAILRARRLHNLRDLSDLRKLGIRAPEQSAPYILLDGRRPPQQLALF